VFDSRTINGRDQCFCMEGSPLSTRDYRSRDSSGRL
jgi:hypothetical protein